MKFLVSFFLLISSVSFASAQDNSSIVKKMKEFSTAVQNNKTKKAIQFLKEKDYAYYIDSRVNGDYVLIYAIKNKQENLAQELITHGANLNCMDKERKTPLMYAIETQNTFLAKLVLNAGADFKIKDKSGATAIDYAQKNQNEDLLALLKNKEG